MARSTKKESNDRQSEQVSETETAQPAEQTKKRARRKRIDGPVVRPHLTLGEELWERVLHVAARRKLPPRMVVHNTLDVYLPHVNVTLVDRPTPEPAGK